MLEARLRTRDVAWEASLEESIEVEPQDFFESGDHSSPHLGMEMWIVNDASVLAVLAWLAWAGWGPEPLALPSAFPGPC
eukprot:9348887-Pyramimonas_sp.AAC.1